MRARLAVAVSAAVVLVAGLVALAAVPTGAATVDGVLDRGDRVAARAEVDDAVVLLVASGSERSLLVAYSTGKGWFGVDVDPPPDGARTVWTATQGGGQVPALSAAYGTSDGARVRVEWADGRTTESTVARDGSWLAARPGTVRAKAVVALAEDGSVLLEEAGP